MGVDYEHKFFILTESEKDSRKKIVESEKLKGYIFFDYEACQIDGIHVPNLVIVEKVCFNCINNLNSFWGRFGMQTNKTKCKFISNPHNQQS